VVTFGSFNAMQKISGRMVELWARILRAVPGSRLALKSRPLADGGAQQNLRDAFASQGIGADRLLLFPPQPTIAHHLALYGNVDIALDTFPYNGTTTTCDALWMGVPVVTLAGKVHRSRVGVSLLSNIGAPDLIAQDECQYVQIAADLARNLQTMKHRRATQREQVKRSPVVDSQRFVRHLEDAYRQMAGR
jgi:protein O-GlcNAc transferase